MGFGYKVMKLEILIILLVCVDGRFPKFSHTYILIQLVFLQKIYDPVQHV